MDISTLQDFNSIIQKLGYAQKDFTFVETDTTIWDPNRINSITGTILITLIKTGKSKEYLTGTGTKWVIAFGADLAGGLYS